MQSVKFLINSDQQYTLIDGKVQIGIHKHPDTVEKILKLCKEYNPCCLISAGDLTDHGYDAKKSWCCFKNGDYDEYGAFMDQFYNPINSETKVLLCPGNHDTYVKFPYRKPIFDLIESEFGNLYYSKVIQNIRFISLGIYPNDRIQRWLSNELKHSSENVVLFWHYNLSGSYSDWWSDEDKIKVYNILFPYHHRIKCIINGHLHSDIISEWRGFKLIIASASQTGLVEIFENGHVDIKFV